jgi:hypothetical protein
MNLNPTGGGPVAGVSDIQALAVAAITALQETDLSVEASLIDTRVLSRSPEQLLEQVSDGTQTVWMFKPMVELIMHELRYIATAPDLSPEARRERIRWTLEAAGF